MAKSKVKVVLNNAGFDELRKSPQMQAILDEHASRVLNGVNAEYGYEKSVRVYRKRATAYVYAKTAKAKADNLRNNSLSKALGGAK